MPYYKFKCEKCCSTFEMIVRYGTKKVLCENCNNVAERETEFGTTFVLGDKGQFGWADNGYKKTNQQELREEMDLNRRLSEKSGFLENKRDEVK